MTSKRLEMLKLKAAEINQSSLLLLSQALNEILKFRHVFVTPYTVILFAAICFLLYRVQGLEKDSRLLIEIVVTLLTGFLGAMIQDKLKQLLDESFIVRRSSGAIRNLRLIKAKIINANKRIKELTSIRNARDLAEISNLIANVEQDIVNSISDWGDVNPNAAPLIGLYESENALRLQEEQIIRLEKRLDEAERNKSKNIKELKNQIQAGNEAILNLRNKIANTNSMLSFSQGPVLTQTSTASLSPSIFSDAATLDTGLLGLNYWNSINNQLISPQPELKIKIGNEV